tara:strand:+ start:42 stop:752 length:711 start_codon:yes stop_codon:yes gene_type:complete
MEKNLSDYKVFKKIDVFSMFEQIVPNYKKKTILDFGGNLGNLISYSNGKILEHDYTCLDLSKEALDILQVNYPNTLGLHWNRYHKMYNPDGNVDEPWPAHLQYDIAFANSVFTHQEIPEMIKCLKYLTHHADRIYFTYIDPNNNSVLNDLINKHNAISLTNKQIVKLKDRELSYVLDGSRVVYRDDIENESYKSIWTIIDTNYLKEVLNSFGFKVIYSSTTISGFNWMEIKPRRIT